MNVLNKIIRNIAQNNLKAFLVTDPANVRYLTGHDFKGDAVCLIFKDKVYVLTDRRYENELIDDCQLVIVKKSLALELKKILGRVKNLGVEDSLTLAQSKKLASYRLKAIHGLVEELRIIKTEDEIKKITKACQLTSQAFTFFSKKLKLGLTEKQIAWEMEKFVREKGAEGLAFRPIVASGENGAKAHASLTDRRLKNGDLLTIDFGIKLNGYHSDMTRTYKIGKVSTKQAKILAIVKKAQREAIKAIKSGVSVKKIDQVARQIIADAGYAKYFSHATGHGLGLAIHEGPRVSQKSKKKLKAGMIITVEPGIYLPDCGVRWEDTVLITKQGARKLT